MTRATVLPIGVLLVATVLGCSADNRKAEDTLAVPGDQGVATEPSTAATTAGGMLDPNSASSAELASLPGLSESAAAAIIALRPVSTMVALNRVLPRNLTEQQRDSVYARLWKPIDLNKATDEEILLIPGVGPRMLHEFKEYRPYTSIEQFRREIGKYVDKTELARLERYVATP